MPTFRMTNESHFHTILQPLPTLLSVLPIRLVNGPNTSSGRVEVLMVVWTPPYFDQSFIPTFNGVWGTVCDDYWSDDALGIQANNPIGTNNANVVCRMLGFEGGKPVPQAFFGQGTLNILMDDVKCTGLESDLRKCERRESGNNCDHSKDVGRCPV